MKPSLPSPRLTRRVALLGAGVLSLSLVSAAQAAPPPLPTDPAAKIPAALPSSVTVAGVEVENSFVSSTGWVKPGDTYPSQIKVDNTTAGAVSNVRIVVREARGMDFTAARSNIGARDVGADAVTWTIPSLPVGRTVLVLEAKAKTLEQEPTLVWRNISSIAEVTVGATTSRAASHGPKVIPPFGGYETARYGDRPFPVVPVDYFDFKHDAETHPASALDGVINDPENPSSTFNLFQENSFGQLFPRGTIGSVEAGSEGAAVTDEDELRFSTPDPENTNTCQGTTFVDPSSGEPLPMYSERVSDDGWYQLPGMRGYYGSDANGSAVVGSLAGVGALAVIDQGCGTIGKAAYDAAVVADPDIDYNDFDTDKDGLVDFFEVIFQGCGGNGGSQVPVVFGCAEPPNDNIWPHSSSLEFYYSDPTTKLPGYTSKDRLKDLEGRELFYTDDTYSKTTTTATDFPAFVRVGPYNVNPEAAIDFASVISHEYGHSLGLPDYYSSGSRMTYGDFSLMATDQSQNIDVIGKKELGWIVPEVVPAGTTPVTGWKDSKVDTGTITWVTPAGEPYVLSAAGGDYGIHNGQAYAASLPGRILIDPKKISEGASGKQVWYSKQGNDFGCPPFGGTNLDFAIPGLEDVPEGTPITATFKTYFDIEWDYDYGFVLAGVPGSDGKVAYTSQESENGYTTSGTNPNQNNCQATYDNGITGTPASYDDGTAELDRVLAEYPDGPFVEDAYDISELAGVRGGVLRFTYSTDPALARLGWLIDDLVVKAGDEVLFETDFEDGDGGVEDPRVYPGGCKEGLSTSGGVCTEGWAYVAAGQPSELEHGYLLEMRDRSGFDFDGRGQSDRDDGLGAAFEPGLLLTYTDEAHGYGNVGTDNPPAQSPLDSTPEPEVDEPDLNDAVFTADEARRSFSDSSADPHVDNYSEPTRDVNKDEDGDGVQPWTFDYDCLSFRVDRMAGNTENADQKYDLNGDVTFTRGAACAPFNYGATDAGPALVARARNISDACTSDVPPNARPDDDGNVHEAAIDCMIWYEIAKGTTDTTYSPSRGVTRAQMASFVTRLLEYGQDPLPAGTDAFADDNGSTHEASINKLAAAKVVSGKGAGRYAPDEVVSREQMASFLVRAYQLRSEADIPFAGDYFGDDNGSVHEQNINKAAAAGFTAGRGGGFDPAGKVLRDQMASFLARTLDLLVEEGTVEAKTADGGGGPLPL